MAEIIREVMNTTVVALDQQATAVEAAKHMSDHNIGDVLVTEDGQRLAGVVTDRDLVVRVLAQGKDPAATPLANVASRQLVTISPDEPIAKAVELMRDKALRRLPVVSEYQLVGIVSIGDLAVEQDPDSALAGISGAPPNR